MVRAAILTRGGKLEALFPELFDTPIVDIDDDGPGTHESTVSPEEAAADIEAFLRAEANGTMTADDLFGDDEDATHATG